MAEANGSAAISFERMKPCRHWGLLWSLLLIALIGRVGLVFALAKMTGGRELSDDFFYFRVFLSNPWILFTGRGLDAATDIAVYSPLIPVQAALVCNALVSIFGEFVGVRLGMVVYDMLGLGLTVWLMIRYAPPPWSRGTWVVVVLTLFTAGSIGSAAIFGQDDTIGSFWSALALWALLAGRPVLAAALGGLGPFTHKIFAPLTSLGIVAGLPSKWVRLATVAGLMLGAYMALTLIRSFWTGDLYGVYGHPIHNSPSIWAIPVRLGWTFSFAAARPWISLVAGVTLVVTTAQLLKRCVGPVESVVAVYSAFFAVFIGIQPEHHQWYLPFLMFFAWKRWNAGDRWPFVAAWGFSFLAYGFKVTYGLGMSSESAAAAGKSLFRQALGPTIYSLLPVVYWTFHLLTLAAAVWLVILSMCRGRTMRTQDVHEATQA